MKLQSLLDHTVRRIVQSSLTSKLSVENGEEFMLDGKWGMDDASGQQTFKQRWASDDSETVIEFEKYPSEEISDKSVFIISFVPLQITSKNNKVMRMNDRPSSVRYCRPIKFTL